jgi:hypothetical protein
MIADRETNLLSFRSVSSMLISGKPCFSDHLIPSVSSAVRFCLSDGGDVDSRRLQRLPIINLSKIFTGMHAVLRSGAIRADHRTSWSVLSAFIHSHVRVFRSPDVPMSGSPDLATPLPIHPTRSQIGVTLTLAVSFASSASFAVNQPTAPHCANSCSGLGSQATFGLIFVPKLAS